MTSSKVSPEPRLDRRAIRFRYAVCSIAALVVCASFAYSPWVGDGPVLCLARSMTGIPCPSCGLTRSFCAMARGAVGEAFAFHLFGPLLFSITVLAIPVSTVELLRGRRFETLAALAFSSRIAWAFAGLLVTYHVARLSIALSSGELLASMQRSVCGIAWSRFIGPS